MATQCPCEFFLEALQALLTIEAKEMQASRPLNPHCLFPITTHVYLLMLVFYETLYFGACHVLSLADIKAQIHIQLKIQWSSGICCGGMRLPCVGIFTSHRVQISQ